MHDVEPIGPQPQERGVHAVGDAAGRPVRHAWNAVAHLGGEDHALAPACERAPQPLLGRAEQKREEPVGACRQESEESHGVREPRSLPEALEPEADLAREHVGGSADVHLPVHALTEVEPSGGCAMDHRVQASHDFSEARPIQPQPRLAHIAPKGCDLARQRQGAIPRPGR